MVRQYCSLSTLSHSRLNEKRLFLGLKLRDIIFATVVMSAPPLDVRDGLNVSQSYFWSRGFISSLFALHTRHPERRCGVIKMRPKM